MKSKEAVVKRINELCAVNDIALNELANRSGITPSTVYRYYVTSKKRHKHFNNYKTLRRF